MQPALHQNARAAQRDCLVNLFANLFERAHVSVRRARPSIERAEGADDVADVRVVDVSIDDVGDDVVGLLALANLVGGRADFRDVVRFEQRRAVVGGQSFPGERAVEDGLNVSCVTAVSLLICRQILKASDSMN